MKLLILIIFLFPKIVSAQFLCGQYQAKQFLTSCSKSKSAPSVLRIFPNPTQDIFQIEGLKVQNTEGVLFDNSGRIIRRFIFKNGQTIDIFDLSASIYFLVVPNEKIIKIIKI